MPVLAIGTDPLKVNLGAAVENGLYSLLCNYNVSWLCSWCKKKEKKSTQADKGRLTEITITISINPVVWVSVDWLSSTFKAC